MTSYVMRKLSLLTCLELFLQFGWDLIMSFKIGPDNLKFSELTSEKQTSRILIRIYFGDVGNV